MDHRTDGYPLCSLSVHIKVLGSPRLCLFRVSPEFYFWLQDSVACGVSPSLGLVVLSLKWEQHSICLTSHSQRGDAYSGKGPPFVLLSHFSRVQLCATPETAAHQAPLSLGFSRHTAGPKKREPVHHFDMLHNHRFISFFLNPLTQ